MANTIRSQASQSQGMRRPVLIVHPTKTDDDKKALSLLQKQFGTELVVVDREEGSERDVKPRLFVAAGVYRGLESIKAFVGYLSDARAEMAS